MNQMEVQRRILKAANTLIFGEPFIGSLLPKMKIEVLPAEWFHSHGVPFATAATDGKNIFCCAEFFDKLLDPEICGVLAHEIFHALLLHLYRREDRNSDKWNAACDYSLNPFVVEIPCCALPTDCLLDDQYANMTADKIYDLLPEDPTQDTLGNDMIEGGADGDETEAEKHAAEVEWKGSVAVAAQNAKIAGTLSKALESYINVLLNPKLPWPDILMNFMVKPCLSIANWSKRNRRLQRLGYRMPGRKFKKTGVFVISWDVSGSMSDEAIELSLAEVRYIVNIIKPEKTIIIEHDSIILDIQEYLQADDLPTKIELHGRGGTDFNPIFNYIETLDEAPEALILFTDGYGSYPEIAPDYPVLWGLVETDKNLRMRYGEHLCLDQ